MSTESAPPRSLSGVALRAIRIFPLAGVTLLTLAACDLGGAATPTSVEMVTATPSAATVVTPSPTPSLDPYPDAADLVISPEGILPLTIGLPPDTNPGAAMIIYNPNHCYIDALDMTAGDLGGWENNNPGGGFSLAADDTAVWRIDVSDPDMPTTEGITIGSTIDELQAAYPGLTEGSQSEVSRVFWVMGKNGYLVFETQDPDLGWSEDLDATGPEVVIQIRVIAIELSPDFHTALSDDLAGACV